MSTEIRLPAEIWCSGCEYWWTTGLDRWYDYC